MVERRVKMKKESNIKNGVKKEQDFYCTLSRNAE